MQLGPVVAESLKKAMVSSWQPFECDAPAGAPAAADAVMGEWAACWEAVPNVGIYR